MKLRIIGQWGGYPAAGGASAGYLLTHEGCHLLIDCGSGVLSKLQTIVSPEKLDGVMLSHYHADHVADIGVLQHALFVGKMLERHHRTLPIYGHTENKVGFSKLTYKDVTKGIAYEPSETVHIGPFAISFLQTIHPAPCFAMRIETEGKSLVYTGDTAYFEEMAEFAYETDILLCESNFYKGMDGKSAGHMTSSEAGQTAHEANAGRLILTHLPHFGDHEDLKREAAETYRGEIMIAASGMELTI